MAIKIEKNDKYYPERLKEIYNAPKCLYALGNLELLLSDFPIAMVGTRKCNDYGLKLAHENATKLSQLGATIVSGFALGIDTVCHKAALDAQGKTIAVLATGLDIDYPKANRDLRKRIEKDGLLLSEYEDGFSGQKFTFAARNRIISGLSLATVVVQAPKRSGALITAAEAISQNRDVYVFCGDMFDESMEGCHNLLMQGAQLLQSPENMMQYYSGIYKKPIESIKTTKQNTKNLGLTKEQEMVFCAVSESPTPFENICEKVDLPTEQILSILITLEIFSLIRELPGKRFQII